MKHPSPLINQVMYLPTSTAKWKGKTLIMSIKDSIVSYEIPHNMLFL